MQPPLNTPSHFDAPTTTANLQFQNSLPPLPNQSSSHMGSAQPHKQNQHPNTQPSYNGPPSSFTPNIQPMPPAGYPQQSHYSNVPSLPPMPGSQLNGPSPYSGQAPSSGPVQQPFPQSRIDPNMVPNVVRIYIYIYIFSKKELTTIV